MSLTYLALFIVGTAFGSFLNVVSLRFNGEGGIFEKIYGRSKCVTCEKSLKWYELIPLVSFIIQLGRCRSCKSKLSPQYPIVELISGLIFIAVPYALIPRAAEAVPYFDTGLWIVVLMALVLMSAIDFRLYIIPDSINIFIGILGIANFINVYLSGAFGEIKQGIYGLISNHSIVSGSFLGTHSFMFSLGDNVWVSYLFGALFGGGFFWALYLLTSGRAIGFGDVKLGLAAGFLLGWPDMFLVAVLSFILGAIWGGGLILLRFKTMKDYLPFGPFIALGITLVFFFGYDIVNAYFRFFSGIF